MRWPTLMLLLALGCSADPSSSAGESSAPYCEAGVTRACTGPGACKGGQQCADDGARWLACDCGSSAGAVGAGGAGGVAGAAGASGSIAGQGGEVGAGGSANLKVGAICVGAAGDCDYLGLDFTQPQEFCFKADATVQKEGKCTFSCTTVGNKMIKPSSETLCIALGGECKVSPLKDDYLCWPPDGLIP